jgi:hypothetical protein
VRETIDERAIWGGVEWKDIHVLRRLRERRRGDEILGESAWKRVE